MPNLQTIGGYIRNLANAVAGRSVPLGVTAGSIGFSAGGPLYLDAFRSKRPPAPYELVNAYKAIAYACIRLNMFGVSRTPLRLYSRTGRNQARPRRSCRRLASSRVERWVRSQPYLTRMLGPDDAVDEITEHPFLEAFDKPNPYFDGEILLQHICASMDVVGTAYFFPTRPLGPDGAPDITQARAGMEIWPFQSQYVYPYKGMGADDLLREYRYFGDSYHPDALVRIRYISLRDPYLSAYSPLHACFEQAGLSDYYTAIVESILKSGARPSMMISPKDANVPLGESERKRIEQDMNNRFTGGRSGHIWVTNGAVETETLQFPPADLAGLQITQFMRLEIANCFDVPISLLQAEDTNRAVASEGSHQHQNYAVAPRCRLIAAALTKQLAQPVDDRLFFCFDDPVARDTERETKIWGMKLADGRATANEAREDEGLDSVEWGDEPWLPGTLKQPTQLKEAHEQNLQQQADSHEVGLKQQEQGLKQSADQHAMAKETHAVNMKNEKEASEKDAEDRARDEEKKARALEKLDLLNRQISEVNEALRDEARVIQDRALKRSDALVERARIRAAAELEKVRLQEEGRKAALKVKRAEIEFNAEIEKEKAEAETKRARAEVRNWDKVGRVLEMVERDIQK